MNEPRDVCKRRFQAREMGPTKSLSWYIHKSGHMARVAGEQIAEKRGSEVWRSGLGPCQIKPYELWREFGFSKCDRKQL